MIFQQLLRQISGQWPCYSLLVPDSGIHDLVFESPKLQAAALARAVGQESAARTCAQAGQPLLAGWHALEAAVELGDENRAGGAAASQPRSSVASLVWCGSERVSRVKASKGEREQVCA